jgi:hypothetical protein
MDMSWSLRIARNTLLRAIACITVSGILLQTLHPQSDRGRRRADLSPISLPGGSTIEFKSFESQSLGMQEHYSVFLPPSFSKDSSCNLFSSWLKQ